MLSNSPRSGLPWRLLALAPAMLIGCQTADGVNNATVQGRVTIDGELAASGTVTFHPVAGGPVAVSAIDPSGSYALRIGQGNARHQDSSRIPAGQYVATVMSSGPAPEGSLVGVGGSPSSGPRLVALKYADPQTSSLTFDVKPGMNVLNLAVEGASADPPPDEAAEDAAGASTAETTTETTDADAAPAVDAETTTAPQRDAEPAEDGGTTDSTPEAEAAEGQP